MSLRAVVAIWMSTGCAVSFAQDTNDRDLAILLANANTRQTALAKIVASGNDNVPLLLSWTQTPPDRVDRYGLYIGLADAFGQLKTKDAIPFLIKNISYLSRTSPVDLAPWLKTAKVITETFPAIGALIRIGPEAARALIRASQGQMTPADRLAAIFAISQTRDVPEGRAFLASALGHANVERYWATEGLKLLGDAKQ